MIGGGVGSTTCVGVVGDVFTMGDCDLGDALVAGVTTGCGVILERGDTGSKVFASVFLGGRYNENLF